MNFLAHSHLSFNNDDIIFGNFIADAVKGNSFEKYKGNIQNGILLHREIDHFTDTHDVFRESVRRVRPDFGKYSGIVIDIYYDHFLARNWNEFSDIELSRFSTRVYMILAKKYRLLPSRTRRILPFLIAQNWLSGYANLYDLNRVFNGMNRRTNYLSGMNNAVGILKQSYEGLKHDFDIFYPDLQSFVNRSQYNPMNMQQ